jgi:hypothetical protein
MSLLLPILVFTHIHLRSDSPTAATAAAATTAITLPAVAATAATVCEQCGRFLTITAGVPDTSSPEFSRSDSISTYTSFTATAETTATATATAATAGATDTAGTAASVTSGNSNSVLQHPLMQLSDPPLLATVGSAVGASNGKKSNSNAVQAAPLLSRSTGLRGHMARRASVFVSPLPADADAGSSDTSSLL